MTNRRDLLKRSTALGLAGVLPASAGHAATSAAEPAAVTEPTGTSTTYTFITFVGVESRSGPPSRYVRTITFTVNHHEHFRDDTVDVLVENLNRPQDDFGFTAEHRQPLSGVLGEIHGYIEEQERRANEDGESVAQRSDRIRMEAGQSQGRANAA